MTWAAADFRAAGDRLPGMDVLGVPATDLGRPDTRPDRPVAGARPDSRARPRRPPRLWRGCRGRCAASSSPRCACGVVTGRDDRVGRSAGHIVAGVITDPATRTWAHWTLSAPALVALWWFGRSTQWLQARLSQRGATAVIADLGARVLRRGDRASPREARRTRATTPRRGDARTRRPAAVLHRVSARAGPRRAC